VITIDANSYNADVYKYKIENTKTSGGISGTIKNIASGLPKTGDNFPIIGVVSAMASAGVVLLILLLYKRRRKEKEEDHNARAAP
jgi:LPXTG-motif cell wall-anchored protein